MLNLSYLEDKETLIKDRLELQNFLEDVEILLHINKYTNEKLYKEKYIFLHKDLSKEDLGNRLVELNNIFHMIKNNKI